MALAARIADTGPDRRVARVADAVRTLEGAGFEVRRPFPSHGLADADPFLLLDEMGPSELGPGEARGAPDHPHRGFETVTYMLSGEMEHRDSAGHAGTLRPGDVQWMTAGSGVVHSELPSAAFQRRGGRMHGFQLWVNLPARDKRIAPRYQELPADGIPRATSDDGLVEVRVVAGEALGEQAVIETRIPITFLHFTVEPGGGLSQPIRPADAGVVYGFSGEAWIAGHRVRSGQVALLSEDGDSLELGVPTDAAEPAELLLLAGEPLREPVARYGPFVMNTQEEIAEAIRDFRAGRLGRIV